ncbi:MAG: hypothetical protein HOP23_03080 [Methylococcaceae bacterium]|nr:hypothetical protein [Methylococcaceae bacterium]
MKLSAKQLKAVTLGVGTVLMMGAGQAAFAHASILNAINSGGTGFSRVGVNHAVNHTTPPTPVVAQSVVFPTVNPILGRTGVGASVSNLGDFFSTSAAGANTTGLLPWVSVAGAPQLVQSKDVFSQQIEQANASNQTIGWVSTKGLLQVNLHGEVPFRFAAPHFRSILPAANPNALTTADLCADKLVIAVAVADISKPTPQPPFVAANPAGLPGSETAGIGYNLWLDNTTPGLATSAFPPQVTENGAATTNLTINRDPVVNPYPANCVPAGGTNPVFTITVKPSADDINALQFPGWGVGITPAAGANGNMFR